VPPIFEIEYKLLAAVPFVAVPVALDKVIDGAAS
jgi:hypothetical protein